MKITTVQYFVTLAESPSINEAARVLHIAQPSLSKSLQLFEEELGVKLFERDNSGIALTEAGKKILPEARQMLEYYNGWKKLSEETRLDTVRIYSHGSLVDFLIPDVIMDIKEEEPGLILDQYTVSAPELFITQDIRKPAFALTICPRNEKALCRHYVEKQGNEPLKLFSGHYECLVSRNSPLAGRASVRAEDLKDLCLVTPAFDTLFEESTFVNSLLHGLLYSLTPSQYMQVASLSLVIDMVRKRHHTYAVSYYPALLRYPGVDTGELIHIPFEGPAPESDVCLFYSKKATSQYQVLRHLVLAISNAAKQFMKLETSQREFENSYRNV